MDALLQDSLRAYDLARRIAFAIWHRHYKDEAPDWQLSGSLAGLMSQIDNMTAGLVKPSKPVPIENRRPIIYRILAREFPIMGPRRNTRIANEIFEALVGETKMENTESSGAKSKPPQSFFDRLIAERAELAERTERPGRFIGSEGQTTSTAFADLPEVQRNLLNVQHLYMASYLDTLDRRIAEIQRSTGQSTAFAQRMQDQGARMASNKPLDRQISGQIAGFEDLQDSAPGDGVFPYAQEDARNLAAAR